MSATETAEAAVEVVQDHAKVATSTFTKNARRAMSQAPDYFVWWYTVKSIGLGVAVALAAYYAGKSHGQSKVIAQLAAGRGTYTR